MTNRFNFNGIKLAPTLAFLAPVGAMLVARMLAVEPPALMAQSDSTGEVAAARPIEGPPATPKQLAARQRSAEIASALMDATPMYYAPRTAPVVEEPEVVLEEPAPVKEPGRPEILPPQVSLSSILRSADGQAIAFLNGKMHRVGDSIGEGWTITAIDPATRRVTIDHAEADSVSITLVDPRRPQ